MIDDNKMTLWVRNSQAGRPLRYWPVPYLLEEPLDRCPKMVGNSSNAQASLLKTMQSLIVSSSLRRRPNTTNYSHGSSPPEISDTLFPKFFTLRSTIFKLLAGNRKFSFMTNWRKNFGHKTVLTRFWAMGLPPEYKVLSYRP